MSQDDGVALGQGRGGVPPQQREVEDLEERGIDEEEFLVPGAAREGRAHHAVVPVAPSARAETHRALHVWGEGLQFGRESKFNRVGYARHSLLRIH